MITILGAGLSGLSAAYHLKDGYMVLEKEREAGGLCRSVYTDGYVFDYAPHILFTRDEYTRNLFFRLLGENLHTHERRAYIYMMNTYVKYPFEANLSPLPRHVIDECIQGVIDRRQVEPHNFMEWIRSTFGDGVARHYMVPYNQKVWKHPLEEMNTDWIAGRVPSPSVEEMRRGAEGRQDRDFGPNAVFWYPKRGGIGALAAQLSKGLNVSLGSTATELKPHGDGVKVVYMKDGKRRTVESDHVLSSLPLPEVVKMIDDAPEEVHGAAERLVHNSLVCVMVGVKRPRITDKHWLYFPEKDLAFNRISFPMNFSPQTTPEGRSSILVEVTYRDHADVEETKIRVLMDLVKAGLIDADDEVETSMAADFKYAYVIYDLDHRKNVNIIHRYLEGNRITPIGRFGEWEYHNMDKAIQSGKRAAEALGR